MLMMHQPLIGWDFTTYLPVALLPYMALLACNALNRLALACMPARRMEFDDDFETTSDMAARGLQLLQQELENHVNGRPLGLSIAMQGDACLLDCGMRVTPCRPGQTPTHESAGAGRTDSERDATGKTPGRWKFWRWKGGADAADPDSKQPAASGTAAGR